VARLFFRCCWSKVIALYNWPFPRLRSLPCLVQRSFPLRGRVAPNAALLKDRVSDFELSIRLAIELGCVPGTIKLLRNGFADWAKEGHVETHLLGPLVLARSARVIRRGEGGRSSRYQAGFAYFAHTSKVDQHAALITSDPGVMTGRHIECITGAVLDLGTIVHLHDHATFEDIAGVRRLA